MSNLQLPSHDAIRERILPGEKLSNTRWLYNVIVELCYDKGQVEGTLAELRRIAGFDAVKSIWPMLCHLQDEHLICMQVQYLNNANQPSKIRIALPGQPIRPFTVKRVAPSGDTLNCATCGETITDSTTHRKSWCYRCYREKNNASKREKYAQQQELKQVAS